MADDPYPVITHGGPGSGIRMWDHDGAEFTNENRILSGERFRAEGNIATGASGTALVLNSKQALVSGDKIASVRNADVERYFWTHEGHPLATGTIWEDFRVGASVVQIGPVNQPSWDIFVGGVRLPAFDVNEEVFFDVQMPHAWKAGSAVAPHIHWAPNGAAINAGDRVQWQLEYEVHDVGGVYVGTSTVTGEYTFLVGDQQRQHFLLDLDQPAPADLSAFEESCVIVCRLSRIAATVNEYAGKGVLLSVDFHYQREKWGTRTLVAPFAP